MYVKVYNGLYTLKLYSNTKLPCQLYLNKLKGKKDVAKHYKESCQAF